MTVYEPYIRRCSVCGSQVWDGYIEADGYRYFCSDECLHTVYTDEEWERVYEEDNSEHSAYCTGSCYTNWYEDYLEDDFDSDGDLLSHKVIAREMIDEFSKSADYVHCYLDSERVIELADHANDPEDKYTLCLLCSEKEWDKHGSVYRKNYSPAIEIIKCDKDMDSVVNAIKQLMDKDKSMDIRKEMIDKWKKIYLEEDIVMTELLNDDEAKELTHHEKMELLEWCGDEEYAYCIQK